MSHKLARLLASTSSCSTYSEIKSAISSHLARFGTLPRMTFLTLRVKPTGATRTAKWRISIKLVVELYENKTQRLIVDKLTVARLIVGNMFWNVCAINFMWLPSPVKLFNITCGKTKQLEQSARLVLLNYLWKSSSMAALGLNRMPNTHKWWMLEWWFVEILFLHGCHHVSGQCKLMNFEVKRRPLRQSGHFER